MSDHDIVFAPTRTQEEFMLSDAYVRTLAGPIGGGKSVACVHELIRWATEQVPNSEGIRKTRFLICRNTTDQLKSTTLKTVFDWIPPSWAGSWVVTDKTFYIRFGLPDGTIVETEWMAIALDTPDDVRKALSLEATGLWGNEARELHPDVVDGLLMRVNRYPSPKDGGPTRPGAIFDTNMPQVGGWWFDKMSNPPGNWSIHVQPTAVLTKEDWFAKHGPGEHRWQVGRHEVVAHASEEGSLEITAKTKQPDGTEVMADLQGKDVDGDDYVVDHEADNFGNLNASYYPQTMEGKTKEFVNVYLRCKFGESKEGQPVFGGFKRDFHVAKQQLVPIEDPNRPLLIGIDFGLTPAATISQIDPRGRLLTFAEATSTNMGIYRFTQEKLLPLLSTRFPGMPVLIIGDPAGKSRSQTDEKTVYDILEEAGLKAIPSPTNDIARRVGAVEEFLSRVVDGTPAHIIDPGCRTLIGALAGGYRYRIRKDGEVEDKPEKNHYSHLMDGHQYTCVYVKEGMSPGGVLTGRRSERRRVVTTPMGAWT